MSSSSFQYKPLHSDTRQKPVRLLQLAPKRSAATIQCQLIQALLIDRPYYEALSYVWGDESSPMVIRCDNGTIKITKNLYFALERLRKEQETCTLWVDAICIDQKNPLELSQQVRQMANIYRYATRTLVWLGPSNLETTKAFQLIPYLLAAHAAYMHMSLYRPQPFIFSPQLERRSTHPAFAELHGQRSLFGAFRQFGQLPYFSRVWIVQELAVSGQKAYFFCGRNEISWTELLVSFATFNRLSLAEDDLRRPWGSFAQIAMTSQDLADGNPPSLLSLLDEYRGKFCKDPRDKVFGLLGLVDPKDVFSFGIEVDYERSSTEIYTKLAQMALRKDKNFSIFRYLTAASPHEHMPSWVPDWARVDELSLPLPYSAQPIFYTGGDIVCPLMRFASSGKDLITPGTIIDKITTIGVVAGPNARGKIIQNWEKILSQVKDENYITGGKKTDAFISTILAGHSHATFRVVKQQFLLWYQKLKRQNPDAFITSSAILDAETESLSKHDSDTGHEEQAEQFLRCFAYTSGRRYSVTERNYFALIPAHSEEGDHVALLNGGTYPLVLRPMGAKWTIIGECYVHGAVHGELFRKVECEDITIA